MIYLNYLIKKLKEGKKGNEENIFNDRNATRNQWVFR